MAMIHVARDGANIGTFSIEEIREGLRTGRFLPTDMAWEAGMPDWRPLSQVMAGKPAAATPAPERRRQTRFRFRLRPELGAGPGGGLPWEHRAAAWIFQSLLRHGEHGFDETGRSLRHDEDRGRPDGPAAVRAHRGQRRHDCFRSGPDWPCNRWALWPTGRAPSLEWAWWAFGPSPTSFLCPVLVIVGVFIASGILHLCLMIVGGAKKPFETTFRVVCFSSGRTYLLSMIPFCGGMIVMRLQYRAGDASAWRAPTKSRPAKPSLAVLLPIIVCCGGVILLGILGGFSALSLFSER